MVTVTVTPVPLSRYHQRVIAIAIYNARPASKDRDRNDDWTNLCHKIGEAIRDQGGHFDMTAWMDICHYGPK